MDGTIYGSLASKANSRRVTRYGVIKSQKAMDFTDTAILQLKNLYKGSPIEKEVGLDVTVFYDSRRPDLSPELFFDCLEKAGVLKNDRLIREYFCRKELDKLNPRVEYSVYILD